jgi:hypothetical protein
VRPATIAFQTERLHEGRVIAVEIPALLVPKCANCGELVFNYAADEQISRRGESASGNRWARCFMMPVMTSPPRLCGFSEIVEHLTGFRSQLIPFLVGPRAVVVFLVVGHSQF